MNFKHAPHPLIEDHYHIQELINAQQARADDRTYHQDKAKALAERENDIRTASPKELKAFWCSKCSEDFLAESIKEVVDDIAFYRTKHWCGKRCLRHITDTHRDAYWFRSRHVARDKGNHFADTLQPYQTGFNMMYKKI